MRILTPTGREIFHEDLPALLRLDAPACYYRRAQE